jgi:hypothetical protein
MIDHILTTLRACVLFLLGKEVCGSGGVVSMCVYVEECVCMCIYVRMYICMYICVCMYV